MKKRLLRQHWLLFLLVAAVGGFSPGCEAPQKTFKIASYPPGATIYIDDEPRGQTDAERLLIKFYPSETVTIRLEKPGFQPTGSVLSRNSSQQLTFFLQEAPRNQRILDEATNIRRLLTQISAQLESMSSNGQ
jgi:hypothetical protein